MRIGDVRVTDVLGAAARHALPFRSSLRRMARSVRPYEDNQANSQYCISQGLEQIAALQASGIVLRDAVVLEFGSGWLPLIPWLLQLAGAGRLLLTDIDRLMDTLTIERARQLVLGRVEDVASVLGQPTGILMASFDEPLRHDYLVPWNAATHAHNSVDVIVSRACLEHVPRLALSEFFSCFRRILRPGGVMCHVVDHSDHWQHKDRSLSRVNFLRFDDASLFWRLAQHNPQAYQNRLRHQDYVDLMEQAGFRVETASGEPDPQCLRDLAVLPLRGRYARADPADLAILQSLFVARAMPA